MTHDHEKASWTKAYEWIRDAIESGELEMGTPLPENLLAREIGVSRTPIREALRSLEQDGYVKIIPQKGAFVSEISLEDLKEIYDIRKLLEPFAALSAVNRIPDGEIDEMERGWKALKRAVLAGEVSLSKVSEMDLLLHMTITKYATNKRIGAIITTYHAQIQRFQKLSAQSLANIHETIGQHVEILEKLRERDARGLSSLLYEHIAKSESNIMKDYFLK
ncbi:MULTISPECIES: GntR family transcriptional regulator [Synergistaceae]|uniref:GntR family transcriptional regulator n=1 Tax=Synergistaceae TaxID=649777 RepID=UPI003AEEEED1|nr:GntR family transcriptional regulator [Synergistaceae bacterium DZ-S4]